jgi:hypothetical protein
MLFRDQGTIKLYVKASSEDADISFKQFNIDEPFFSIIKTEVEAYAKIR